MAPASPADGAQRDTAERRHVALRAFLALATVTTLLAATTCGGGGGGSGAPVDALPRIEADARPEWDDSPTPAPAERTETPSVVEVHLDISFPMAGFLPLPGREDELSTFHVVTQNVGQHMARVYGRAGGVTVRWLGVGHQLRDLRRPLRIRPALFDGRSTRLDLSIERVLDDFRSGRAEAAALVTDLMATAEGSGVTGPLTVANALAAWLRSEDVRSGAFHVGLLGVKAEYRGVTPLAGCGQEPPLGCWFDERLPGYRPLDDVARIPFYVLVLGRGAEAVASVLESLQRGIVELDRGIEAQWELLTRRTPGLATALSCAARQPQYALFADERQQQYCVRDDLVTLDCTFENGFRAQAGRGIWERTPAQGSPAESTPGGNTPAGRPSAEGASAEGAPAGASQADEAAAAADADADANAAPPPPVAPAPAPFDLRAVGEGQEIEVDIDCGVLRGATSADESLTLALDVTGAIDEAAAEWRLGRWAQQTTGGAAADNTADWSAWTTELAALDRTLHLDGFVQAVRLQPDRYRVSAPALLRLAGS